MAVAREISFGHGPRIEIDTQNLQRAMGRIQPDDVAVLQLADGSATGRLGRDMDRGRHLARGPRHPPIRDQRHFQPPILKH